MQIVYLNHNVIWRSAFHRCFHLAKSMVKRGHEVTIITNSPTERWGWKTSVIEGVNVVESPDLLKGALRTGWDPVNVIRRCLWSVSRWRECRDVLVHAFDTRPTVIHPALALQETLKCPLVIDWGDWWGHGGAARLRKPFWLNFLFEPMETAYEEDFKLEADWVTCVSQLLRERAISLGVTPERIEVIRNVSDPAEIQKLDREECRRKLGLREDIFYVVFSGYVLYDLDLVFRSMVHLARIHDRVGLILTGSAPDVRSWATQFEILTPGTVSREKLNQYLCAANVALMPLSNHLANQARFPGKVGDYLAAGLPVVMNRVGDVARVLEEAKLGIFCDPTPRGFACALYLLMCQPEEQKRLGELGRRFAETSYNWERESARLATVYERLMAER